MGSFDVPFSFLIILNTFEIGVLLFIFEAYFLKEIFFASLIVLRAFALAILKFVWLRYEGFVKNFCRALLGLGEVLGMFFSAMDKRVFVYSSIFISFEMFRCSLHWVLNSSQFAFLKMKRSGIF